VNAARRPSLAEQARQLSALRQRIETIREDADLRAHATPAQARRIRESAEAEVAPLIAQGAALRDAIVLRAHARARLARRVAYAVAGLGIGVLSWYALQ
jgi:hypothetical protein